MGWLAGGGEAGDVAGAGCEGSGGGGEEGGEVEDGVGCCGEFGGRRDASRIMVFAWEKDVYVHGMAVGASWDAGPAGAF